MNTYFNIHLSKRVWTLSVAFLFQKCCKWESCGVAVLGRVGRIWQLYRQHNPTSVQQDWQFEWSCVSRFELRQKKHVVNITTVYHFPLAGSPNFHYVALPHITWLFCILTLFKNLFWLDVQTFVCPISGHCLKQLKENLTHICCLLLLNGRPLVFSICLVIAIITQSIVYWMWWQIKICIVLSQWVKASYT